MRINRILYLYNRVQLSPKGRSFSECNRTTTPPPPTSGNTIPSIEPIIINQKRPCNTCRHFVFRNHTCRKFIYHSILSGETESIPIEMARTDERICGRLAVYHDPLPLDELNKKIQSHLMLLFGGYICIPCGFWYIVIKIASL